MIKLFVQYSCVEGFYGLSENFVSRPFKFRIYEEMLTWPQLLFKIGILDFVEDFVTFNICSLDKKAMMSVFMWTSSVEAGKILATKFIIKGEIRFWGAVRFWQYDNSDQFEIYWRNCGQWVQNNFPAEQLLLWQARLGFAVWVSQSSHVTFSLWLRENI